jgi:hypothetical protein
MDRGQANLIAGEFLRREGETNDPAAFQSDLQAVSGSLEALLPDLETWAIIEMQAVRQNADDPPPMLIGVQDQQVWTASVKRPEGEHHQWPQVFAGHHDSQAWKVASVGDSMSRDHGARVLRRGWDIELSGERFMFATEQLVRAQADPSPEERLGRALAAAKGWEIGDVSQDEP